MREATLLPANNEPSPKVALVMRRRRFQLVLTALMNGAQYAKQVLCKFVLHPGVEGSNTYDHEVRLMCRVALDGKGADLFFETRSRIVGAMWYNGRYLFQLQRYGRFVKMGPPRLLPDGGLPLRAYTQVLQ